jgi:hypothetical protein
MSNRQRTPARQLLSVAANRLRTRVWNLLQQRVAPQVKQTTKRSAPQPLPQHVRAQSHLANVWVKQRELWPGSVPRTQRATQLLTNCGCSRNGALQTARLRPRASKPWQLYAPGLVRRCPVWFSLAFGLSQCGGGISRSQHDLAVTARRRTGYCADRGLHCPRSQFLTLMSAARGGRMG